MKQGGVGLAEGLRHSQEARVWRPLSKHSSHEPGQVPGSAWKGLLVCLEKETRLAMGPYVILP